MKSMMSSNSNMFCSPNTSSFDLIVVMNVFSLDEGLKIGNGVTQRDFGKLFGEGLSSF